MGKVRLTGARNGLTFNRSKEMES